MWLTSSSIGRKLVMAITGCCLVLFLTFHVLMNAVCLIWPTVYNQICELLGANWYALVATVGLAGLFILHILYAVWLTLQNRAARGADCYAVTSRPPQVEWSSKNMLVLGIVVVAFMVVHFIQFWAKMQLIEAQHPGVNEFALVDGVAASPAMGTLFIQEAFKCIWTPVIYIIGFAALWFHMNHGFWSMFHTAGWNNNIWMSRLKTIACVWTSVVVGLFTIQAVVFTVLANQNYYTENVALQEQYAEYWDGKAAGLIQEFQDEAGKVQAQIEAAPDKAQELRNEFFLAEGARYIDAADAIQAAFEKQCNKVKGNGAAAQMSQFSGFIKQSIEMAELMQGSVTNPGGAVEAEAEVTEETDTIN